MCKLGNIWVPNGWSLPNHFDRCTDKDFKIIYLWNKCKKKHPKIIWCSILWSLWSQADLYRAKHSPFTLLTIVKLEKEQHESRTFHGVVVVVVFLIIDVFVTLLPFLLNSVIAPFPVPAHLSTSQQSSDAQRHPRWAPSNWNFGWQHGSNAVIHRPFPLGIWRANGKGFSIGSP